jgi:hypothetical protein
VALCCVQFLEKGSQFAHTQISDAVTLLNAIEEYSAAQNEMFGQIPRTFFRGGNLRGE